jgi:hypothetical protein
MTRLLLRASICLLVVMTCAARTASAQTCITLDEQHDTLSPDERPAALLLVKKEFELAGRPIADRDCQVTYSLSHIRLGTTIIVTLAGPSGSRQGKALGLDDLPAVYSQMVRSLVTGQPMGSLAVVDRTNVTASQDLPPRRVQSEGAWNARVGYASLFGPSTSPAASFGFGYRAEFDRLGLDFSFLNFQTSGDGGYSSGGHSVFSLIKLEGLYFTNPTGNRSAYAGGGLSYGRTEVRMSDAAMGYPKYGDGAGLQGELTAGYEIARVTSVRLFVQADATLPFYHVVFETYGVPQPSTNGRFVPPTVTIERKYMPSLTLSVGFGWSRWHR